MVLRREMILQRDASTYKCCYTEILSTQRCFLHTGALRYKYFYTEIILLTQVPLHRDAFTQVFLHVNTSTVHSAFRTHSFTLRILYTKALLHRGILTHTHSGSHVYMQILVHAGVDFASQGCLWSHMLLHSDIFTQRHLRTEERNAFLHTNTFTERWFYTEQFYTETKTNRGAFTKECMCTKGFLATGIFTQTYYWIISCGGHAYGAKNSANICKITVSPQLLMVETHFVGKGWPRTNPHCNLTSMHDDRHFVRTGCVSWTSIHAALPLEEKS